MQFERLALLILRGDVGKDASAFASGFFPQFALFDIVDISMRMDARGLAIGVFGPGRAFDVEEGIDGIFGEAGDADFEVSFSAGQVAWISWNQAIACQVRCAADSIEQIAGQGQVQHLFLGHGRDDIDRSFVGLGFGGIRRRQIGRNRGVFQLQRDVEILFELLDGFDWIGVSS